MLSVVLPAYNEEKVIGQTAARIGEVLDSAHIPYELIFVNDGSKDSSWQVISDLALKDPHVRGVCFSRNFGKEAAMLAGLAEANGDCCVVMDCDLQDPPETIPEMYALWQQGYEIIEGVKRSRGEEDAGYGLMSRLFYQLISSSTGFDMSRTSVEFDVQERAAGTTKWSKWGLVKYAVTNITSFTTVPMHLVLIMGILMLILAIGFGAEALYRWIVHEALGGFTTVILLQLIIGSITMISLGVIGFYIARIFEEVRMRPRYIVSERAGEEKNSDANRSTYSV